MKEFNPELCDERHKVLEQKIDVSSKKLEQHDCNIQELKEVSTKLTTIVEFLTDPARNQKFLDTPTGKKVVNALIIISLAITGTAVGVNLIQLFK